MAKSSRQKNDLRVAVIAGSLSAVLVTGWTQTAQADVDTMRHAFANFCMSYQPSLMGAAEALEGAGWDGTAGADLGEYEFHNGDTSVFLATSQTGPQPGCAIMDEATSIAQATDILKQTLSAIPPAQWAYVEGDYGPYWKLFVEEGYLSISVQDDLSGNGSAISFELRQD